MILGLAWPMAKPTPLPITGDTVTRCGACARWLRATTAERHCRVSRHSLLFFNQWLLTLCFASIESPMPFRAAGEATGSVKHGVIQPLIAFGFLPLAVGIEGDGDFQAHQRERRSHRAKRSPLGRTKRRSWHTDRRSTASRTVTPILSCSPIILFGTASLSQIRASVDVRPKPPLPHPPLIAPFRTSHRDLKLLSRAHS